MDKVVETKFIVEGKERDYLMPVTLHYKDDRIEFIKSPFALKNEIKAMEGSRWHGFLEGDKRKIWSIANSGRNRFQIEYMEGGNPYEWFDRPLIEHDFPKFGSPGFGYFDLMSQQRLMANMGLTYHYGVWGAEMGTGKTLAQIAMMELSGVKGFWWVGPKNSLYGIRQEFAKWGLTEGVVDRMMSYERLLQIMRDWKKGDPAPQGVVFDESQWLKTPNAQRTRAAQKLADAIRAEYDKEGFVTLMTGTPSPKSPGDWWAPCEIAWPGFVREGSRDAFEKRLGFFRLEDTFGQTFNKRVAWRDDERRCDVCGYYEHTVRNDDGDIILAGGNHFSAKEDIQDGSFERHDFKPSENEVSALYERLQGLVTIVHKKDCLELPDKIYEEVDCEPAPSLLRVAGALAKTAPNVITGLTLMRELSDGFQYRDVEDGYEDCPICEDGTVSEYYHPNDEGASIVDLDMLDPSFVAELKERVVKCRKCKGTQQVVKMKRITKQVPCPKDAAVETLLERCHFQGRIVFFAGFTGSLDRIVEICQRNGWDTMRVDGRGWDIQRLVGKPKKNSAPETEKVKLDNPMDYWIDPDNERVAFIAHPKSGGVSLTLCPQGERRGATVACFYSNDYNPATRSQAEDRIHRTGMDTVKGATIVDLFHLPTDRRVLNVLRQNRKLELMSMGDFTEDLEIEDDR